MESLTNWWSQESCVGRHERELVTNPCLDLWITWVPVSRWDGDLRFVPQLYYIRPLYMSFRGRGFRYTSFFLFFTNPCCILVIQPSYLSSLQPVLLTSFNNPSRQGRLGASWITSLNNMPWLEDKVDTDLRKIPVLPSSRNVQGIPTQENKGWCILIRKVYLSHPDPDW